MSVAWVGNKPGTFINESTVVPLDADNMNAINKTLAKIAEGGENTGLDADTWRSLTPAHLWNVSDENLDVYYSFDSYFGDGKLVDDIGNNHDATVFGDTQTEVGLSGRALVLNGTDSYVQSTYSNSDKLSMSFWIKTQSASGTYKIGSLFSAESSLKFYTELVDGEVFFKWRNSSGLVQSISGGLINDGEYHHVCVVHNSVSGIIYVDGNFISQLDETLSPSYFNKLRIGASEEIAPTLFLQASIDDFRVYSRSLSETEVYGLYFNKSGAKTQTYQTPTHQLFVDNSRTDIYTQDGTLIKPFKTIQSAIDSITDSSVSNSYEIKIISGSNYIENLNINKDYITLSFSEAMRNVGLRGNISITGNNIVFSNVTFLGESNAVKNCILTINSTTQKTLLFRYCFIKYSNFNFVCSDEQPLSYLRFFDCDIQNSVLSLRGFKKELSAIGGFIQESEITIQESNFDLTSSNVKTNTFEFNADSVSNLCSGYYDENIYNVNSDSVINAYTDSASIENTFNDLGGTINYKGDSARFIPSTVIYVDGNRTDVYEANGTIIKPFKTIQEALDVECSNCEIWLYPKIYDETLVLSSDVVLRANSATITQITLNNVNANVEIHSAKITNLISTTINNAKIIGCEITNTTITDCKCVGVDFSYLGSISSQSGNASISSSKINTVNLSQDCFFDIHNCDFTGEATITAIDSSKLFLSSCKKVETSLSITLNTTSICKMLDCEFDLATCNNTEVLTSNCIGAISGTNVKGFDNIISSAKMQLGSDAENDLYFRNSDGNLDRLPVGLPAQILSVGATNNLQWKNEEYKNSRSLIAGEPILANQLCFISLDGKAYLTSANSESTSAGELIIAKENVDINLSGLFHIFGDITLSDLVVGPYYISETSGEISSEPPTSNGKVVRCVGSAVDSTTLNFQPSNEYFVLQTPDDVEQNGYFFSNSKIETDINGYTVYNDSTAIPVNGIDGTPTVSLDFVNTSELIGVGCGKFTKTATNSLGQGFSKDFLINKGFTASKVNVEFAYKTNNSYSDGDLRIYIYDIDTSTLLQNDSLVLKKSTSQKIFNFSFVANENSLNYRIIFHIPNSNTNGFEFYFDNFKLDFKQNSSTIVVNNNFSLPIFADREQIELFNDSVSDVTITLPTGETYYGQNTFSLPSKNLLKIIKINNTWNTLIVGNADTATQALAIKPLGNSITPPVAPISLTRIIKIATVNVTYSGSINIGCSGINTADAVKVYINGDKADTSGIRVLYGKLNVSYGIKKIIVTCDTLEWNSNRQIYAEIVTYPNYKPTTTLGVVETNRGTFTPSMTEVSSVEGTVVDSLSLDYLRGDISSYQHEFTKNIIGNVIGTVTGNVTGNAGTATKLATARKINGVSFDGSADITVADSTKAPTSHASSATTYGVASESNYGHAKASGTTPKINGTASVGTEVSTFARGDHVHPIDTTREPAFTKNTAFNKNFETTASNIKANGTQSVGSSSNVPRADHVHPLQTSVSGNAGTATKLATARKINGVLFDGSADITVKSSIPIGAPSSPQNGDMWIEV